MRQLWMADLFKKSIVVYISSFLFLCASVYSKPKIDPDVTQKIEGIPLDDRKVLIGFFKGMLSRGDFAAVLFDAKPASVHDWPWWCVQYPEKNNYVRNHLLLTYNGWNVWHKYAQLFALKYVFIEQGYNNGMFTLWFTKRGYEELIKKYIHESPAGTEKHRQLGRLLGFPEKDIEGFCEERELQLLKQYFPFDIASSTASLESDEKISDLIEKYSEEFPYRLENIENTFFLRTFCSPSEPFFPSRGYSYRSFTQETNEQDKWKQKVADLYNSDSFLEEIITLMVDP